MSANHCFLLSRLFRPIPSPSAPRSSVSSLQDTQNRAESRQEVGGPQPPVGAHPGWPLARSWGRRRPCTCRFQPAGRRLPAAGPSGSRPRRRGRARAPARPCLRIPSRQLTWRVSTWNPWPRASGPASVLRGTSGGGEATPTRPGAGGSCSIRTTDPRMQCSVRRPVTAEHGPLGIPLQVRPGGSCRHGKGSEGGD